MFARDPALLDFGDDGGPTAPASALEGGAALLALGPRFFRLARGQAAWRAGRWGGYRGSSGSSGLGLAEALEGFPAGHLVELPFFIRHPHEMLVDEMAGPLVPAVEHPVDVAEVHRPLPGHRTAVTTLG